MPCHHMKLESRLPIPRLLLALGLGLGLAWLGAAAARAEFLLTEFMAANKTTLADEDGLFSDWIEIYNPDQTDANLSGWFLTDDSGDLKKWQFPSTNLVGGGYLVVFASGHDRRISGAPLHTSFRLNAEGGYLALVKPNGAIATEFGSPTNSYPIQADDISYGLVAGDPSSTSAKLPRTPTAGTAPVA